MTEQEKNIDALLATAVRRLLNSAATINRMRDLHRCGQTDAYWSHATHCAEDLQIVGHVLVEAHRLLLGNVFVSIQPHGGLPN